MAGNSRVCYYVALSCTQSKMGELGSKSNTDFLGILPQGISAVVLLVWDLTYQIIPEHTLVQRMKYMH